MATMDHPMLKELCEALGWQGGTIWQVLAEVKRMKAENEKFRSGVQAAAYKINPLKWEWNYDSTVCSTDTVFGNISVENNDGTFHWRYCFDEYYDEGQENCESVEDGKSKATEFYLKRLLPALTEATDANLSS